MEILFSDDFEMISLKHFQLFVITIPGQDKYRPAKIPENRNNNALIFLNINYSKVIYLKSRLTILLGNS